MLLLYGLFEGLAAHKMILSPVTIRGLAARSLAWSSSSVRRQKDYFTAPN